MEEEQLMEMQNLVELRNDAYSFAREALGKGGKVVIKWFDVPVRSFMSLDEFEAFWKQQFDPESSAEVEER